MCTAAMTDWGQTRDTLESLCKATSYVAKPIYFSHDVQNGVFDKALQIWLVSLRSKMAAHYVLLSALIQLGLPKWSYE